MTAEERQRIHRVLEECNGDRKAAAEILGFTAQKLRNAIHSSPELKAAWSTPDSYTTAPTPEQVENRSPLVRPEVVPPQPVIKPGYEVARTLVKEEETLRAGLGKILKPNQIELAVSLGAFQAKHYTVAADILGGSMVKAAASLLENIEKLEKRMEEGFEQDELGIQEEQMVRDSYHRSLETLSKIKDKVDQSAYQKALIELKKKQAEQSKNGKARGKPGFAPLQVNIDASNGSKVELKTNEKAEKKAS